MRFVNGRRKVQAIANADARQRGFWKEEARVRKKRRNLWRAFRGSEVKALSSSRSHIWESDTVFTR
jgi:hypothetical protein